jgi:hypothetical protein
MNVNITVKEVNAQFDQALADREYEGQESADNILYNWEDEFEVKADVKTFKIHNNTSFMLEAEMNGEKISHEIPGMSIIECITSDDQKMQFAISRKLIKDTKKITRENGDIRFFVFLRDGKKHVSPFSGTYIAREDFPKGLPLPAEEEMSDDDFDFGDEEE